jgi:DnaJ-domain-containing protein 1
MRSSVLLAKGGDADIELTTHQQAKYVVDVKSRNDRMDLKAPKGDRAKSWTEIHEQVVGAARQLQGVPVVWQPLARDEDFSLVGEAWCLRGPAQTLIEALGALGSAEPDEGASPYQVLGLKPGATREEIQSAYKVLAKQYHPDRVASLGEEFRLLAERRMKVINAAYQALIGK